MRKPGNPFAAFLWRGLRIVAVTYVLVAVLAYVFQRRLQYFPSASLPAAPTGPGAKGFAEVEVVTRDAKRLRAWRWEGTRPITIYILHGNAGHRGHRLEWIEDLRRLGAGVFILDYRGYGGSEGSPTEEGLYLDAEAGAAWLKEKAAGKVVYLGESLGGAVAVELAIRAPPDGLILQSAFTSAVDVARRAYPFLPVKLLMKDRYEAAARIGHLSCPLLSIHGASDSIVPRDLGRALFEKSNQPKEWYEVPRADHNDLPWVGGPAYYQKIEEFLRRIEGG